MILANLLTNRHVYNDILSFKLGTVSAVIVAHHEYHITMIIRKSPMPMHVSIHMDSIYSITPYKVEPFHYGFKEDDKLSGFIETLTPYLKCIPEEKRTRFIDEYTQEFKRLRQKETRPEGDLLIWDAECLVVVLRKS